MRNLWLLVCGLFAACVAAPDPMANVGSLLLVGGGLDNDTAPVWQRFLALAARAGTPHVVVMTAATGPQDEEATDKSEALRTWAPGVAVEVVRRETSTADTVAAIERATALFFTGGDQKRILARYRPDGAATPEWRAMQQLLARGGCIAGASAGCAMMGVTMLEGGRSAQALGIAAVAPDDGGEPAPLGPRLGPGMGFLPWGLTDSHFFERDRLGRLVAGLVARRERLGFGVGEDAALQIDLATTTVECVSVSEVLLVDAAHASRDGNRWTGLRARVLRQGERVSLRVPPGAAPAAVPTEVARDVPVAEPGQNRQLASWRLFRQAEVAGAGVLRLAGDGYCVRAVADGSGGTVFAIDVGPAR